MATEQDIEVLKREMLRQEIMKVWRLKFSAISSKILAWKAKDIFEERLRTLRLSGVSKPDLHEIAKSAIQLAPEGLVSQNARNSRQSAPIRKPNPKRRARGHRRKGAKIRSRATIRTPVDGAPVARGVSQRKPLNPRYKADLRTPIPTDDNHRARRGGGYNPIKVVAASRTETPKYAKYIDDGIGGTREQAVNERKKLSKEQRDRLKE